MACKGICHRFAVKNGTGSKLRYSEGYKRCQECGVFLMRVWTLPRCPCCKTKLRTKPRSRRNKELYRRRVALVI